MTVKQDLMLNFQKPLNQILELNILNFLAMAKFKIINLDQMHEYTHYVEAPDKETAMKRFAVGHYGQIIDCEEIKPKIKCPHCGKEI